MLNGFGKSLEVILPKLGNGYIVPDQSAGRELALENPDAFFLSQSGECFHNVTVTGGKQRSQGPLSMKRELREVLQQMGEMERAMAEQEMRVAALGREIAELTGLLQRLEDDKREAERQAMTSGHTLHQLESEMARVRERLSTYERELRRVAEERARARELSSPDKSPSSIRTKRNSARSKRRCRQRRAAWNRCACAAMKPRSSPAKFAPRWRLSKSGGGARCLRVQRIEAMVSEVSAHLAKLKSQLDSAAAEKQQREVGERSPGRTGRSRGPRSANWRRRAIARLQEELQRSECAWRNWKRR